jgi:hypothetical protein
MSFTNDFYQQVLEIAVVSSFIVGVYLTNIICFEPTNLDNLYLAVSFTRVTGRKARLYNTQFGSRFILAKSSVCTMSSFR